MTLENRQNIEKKLLEIYERTKNEMGSRISSSIVDIFQYFPNSSMETFLKEIAQKEAAEN